MSTEGQSKVEKAKLGSRFLRGTLREALESEEPVFGEDDVQVLKFHGIYQQEDRDARTAARATGSEKQHWFMVRVAMPGGVLTADQYLEMDRIAERFSYNRSLRATTRQGIQLHGVGKGDLKPTLARVNEALLTTLAACGDVERNIMASPAPLDDPLHRATRRLARELAHELRPRTGAYHEIWLDGERVAGGEEAKDREPLYGDRYLPRKFKTAIALPGDNSVDVYAQDVGLIAVGEGDDVRGMDVLVGGGLGMTHKKPDTFARLASPLGFVETEHAAAAVRVVATIFRDHGNRSDRRHARLKYLVEEWGIDRFRDEFVRRADFPLHPWVPVEVGPAADLLGSHPQGDGRVFYGVYVENGRIIDGPRRRLKTALGRIVEHWRPEVILTPGQNVILVGLDEEDISGVEKVLAGYGVRLPGELTAVRRHAMACPALPTCGLALSESERAFPDVLEELERELERLGLEDEPIAVRMTGCPNGCARPYTADVGLVGRGPGRYDVYIGGGLAGVRLGRFFRELVPVDELVATLRPLLEEWRSERIEGEALGDFYQRRYGHGEPSTILTGAKEVQEPPV